MACVESICRGRVVAVCKCGRVQMARSVSAVIALGDLRASGSEVMHTIFGSLREPLTQKPSPCARP